MGDVGIKKIGEHTGRVIEALPGTRFKLKMQDETEVHAYLAGRMRINRIKVLVGDTVLVEVDDYGQRGRIIKRL